MKLVLDKDYFIQSDKLCFKLYKYEYFGNKMEQRVKAYYSNLNNCIKAYVHEKLCNSKAKKSEEVIKELENILTNIENLYKFIDKQGDVYVKTLYRLLRNEVDEKTLKKLENGED